MSPPLAFGPPVVVLIACLPGVIAWWTGRGLIGQREDPALAELLMARQQRLLFVGATALALMLVLGWQHAVWGIPLSMLAILAGRYPLRRVLLGETAGLSRYLWLSLKSIIGGWGFWLALLLAPVIVLSVGAQSWLVAVALLAVLLLWEHGYLRVWLKLHDAVPLVDPRLEPRVQAILERAGMEAPDLHRVGSPGTRYVNALALPSATRPGIGLGNALLDLLEPDEIAAIYAHELSHLEQFSPRVVRRFQFVTRVLIVLAVGLPLLLRWQLPGGAGWLAWFWPVIVLGVLVHRARQSQQRETESDLRAAALCGDAEAVVRALVKVHVHAFIPRRWPVDVERSATHPSLTRRIQALRGTAATLPADAPAVLPTAREGSMVAFDSKRAWWFDGVPLGTSPELESLRAQATSVRSVAWPELIELRITTKGADRALRAEHRNGDSWSVPVAGAQVGELQKALDVVDVRLRRELGKRPAPIAPLIALATLLAMLMSGQYGVLLIPVLLLLVRPSTASMAATGVMALAGAVLGILMAGRPAWPLDPATLGLGAIAALGVAALLVARNRLSQDGRRDGVKLTLIVLGAAATVLFTTVALGATSMSLRDVLQLPVLPTLAITLLGGAAALATSASVAARRTALAATFAAALTTMPALIVAGEKEKGIELAHAASVAVEVARVDLGTTATGLRLSPGGARFIVQQPGRGAWSGVGSAGSVRHIVGAPDGLQRAIQATQVEFLDDQHVFVLQAGDTASELRLDRADSAVTLWSATLPALLGPKLVVAPADRTWAVVGSDLATDSLQVVSGTADSPHTRTHHYAPHDTLGPIDRLVFDGGAKLIVPTFRLRARSSFPLALAMLSGFPSVELWSVDSDGAHKVGAMEGYPQCGQPDAGIAVCMVRERSRTRVWTLDASGQAKPVQLYLRDAIIGAPGSGPTLTLSDGGQRVMHVDLGAGRLTTVTLASGITSIYEVNAAAGRLALLQYETATVQVVFLRMN